MLKRTELNREQAFHCPSQPCRKWFISHVKAPPPSWSSLVWQHCFYLYLFRVWQSMIHGQKIGQCIQGTHATHITTFESLSFPSFDCGWHISPSVSMRHYVIWRFCVESIRLPLCCYSLPCEESMADMSSSKVLWYFWLAELWLKIKFTRSTITITWLKWGHLTTALEQIPKGLIFTWWWCCGLCLCLWHKPTKLAHSFLFCSCVCFRL